MNVLPQNTIAMVCVDRRTYVAMYVNQHNLRAFWAGELMPSGAVKFFGGYDNRRDAIEEMLNQAGFKVTGTSDA